MKRWMSILAVLTVILLLAAACGAPPSSAPAVEEPAPADAAAEPAAEEAAVEEGAEEPAAEGAEGEPTPVPTATTIVAEAGTGGTQLIYWNGLTGSDGTTHAEIIETFTQENPDVSVRIEMMVWATYFDKLLTSLVSGNPPDLFLLHEYEIPEFASQGVLADSSEFFDSAGGPIPEADVYPKTLEALSYEGGRYGVPLDIHGWGLWYNKDLFEAAGLDPEVCPATGDQLIEFARQLTVDVNGNTPNDEGFDPENVDQWGVQVAWLKPTVLSTAWQFGGDWIDAEGNAAINSPEFTQAVQWWLDAIEQEHVAPRPAGFDGWQTFAAGKLAMTPEGSWFLNFVEQNEVNWGVCPFPTIGNEPAAWTSSHVLYTPTTLEGEKLDAAKRLMAYLSEHGYEWAASGMPPVRMSVMENDITMETRPSAKILGDSFNSIGRYDHAHRCINEIIGYYEPNLDQIFNGLITVEEGLNDANARIQEILDRCQ